MNRLLLALLAFAAPLAAQPGTLDPAFGTGGRVALGVNGSTSAVDVVVSPSGRIFVGGGMDGDTVVLALLADGTPDLSFGTNGQVVVDLGGDDLVTSLAPTSDGGIFATVSSSDAMDESRGGFAIRLTASGTLATGFGTDGVITDPTLSGYLDVALGTNGDLYLLGSRLVQETPSHSTSRAVVHRRDAATGAPDTAYGTDGEAQIDADAEAGDGATLAQAFRLLPDGSLYVGGSLFTESFRSNLLLIRLDADGELDASFGTNGIVITNPDEDDFLDQVVDLTLDDQERPVLAAVLATVDPDLGIVASTALLRFETDGQPDATFGTVGVLEFDDDPDATVGTVAVEHEADGRLLIGGAAGDLVGNDVRPFTGRLSAAGAFDPTFGTDGLATIPVEGTATSVARLVRVNDDRALALLYAIDGSTPDAFELVAIRLTGTTSAEPAPSSDALALRLSGPNPFRGTTQVTVSALEPGPVRLALVDVRGREVAVLHDGPLADGTTFSVDGSALAPGVYLLRATSASVQAHLRLVRE